MADSIPSLRIKLDAANAEIARLKDYLQSPADSIIYREVDRPVEVIRHVDRPVIHEVEVERIVYVDRIVEVPVTVYTENPDHIATISALKEKVCQLELLLASEPAVGK